MPDPRTCATCAWWKPATDLTVPPGHQAIGRCHGAPPVGASAPVGAMPHNLATHERVTLWPLTGGLDFCGGWSKAPPVVP